MTYPSVPRLRPGYHETEKRAAASVSRNCTARPSQAPRALASFSTESHKVLQGKGLVRSLKCRSCHAYRIPSRTQTIDRTRVTEGPGFDKCESTVKINPFRPGAGSGSQNRGRASSGPIKSIYRICPTPCPLSVRGGFCSALIRLTDGRFSGAPNRPSRLRSSPGYD